MNTENNNINHSKTTTPSYLSERKKRHFESKNYGKEKN